MLVLNREAAMVLFALVVLFSTETGSTLLRHNGEARDLDTKRLRGRCLASVCAHLAFSCCCWHVETLQASRTSVDVLAGPRQGLLNSLELSVKALLNPECPKALPASSSRVARRQPTHGRWRRHVARSAGNLFLSLPALTPHRRRYQAHRQFVTRRPTRRPARRSRSERNADRVGLRPLRCSSRGKP
jgi:hypothetical protein